MTIIITIKRNFMFVRDKLPGKSFAHGAQEFVVV